MCFPVNTNKAQEQTLGGARNRLSQPVFFTRHTTFFLELHCAWSPVHGHSQVIQLYRAVRREYTPPKTVYEGVLDDSARQRRRNPRALSPEYWKTRCDRGTRGAVPRPRLRQLSSVGALWVLIFHRVYVLQWFLVDRTGQEFDMEWTYVENTWNYLVGAYMHTGMGYVSMQMNFYWWQGLNWLVVG